MRFEEIPINRLVVSPLNPRRAPNEAQLADLIASIRELGVLEPLIVRACEDKHADFEVVAGQRRFLAADLAGLDDVPCVVRDLTEAEAIEVSLSENDHREGIDPIAEASAIKRLLELDTGTEMVAQRLGRSESWLVKRLALLSLPGALQNAVSLGEISIGVAAMVGRIPDAKLRDKAAERVLVGHPYHARPFTASEVREWIEQDYMLVLKDAPFPTRSADLVPERGPCQECPYRTGNQGALFDDVHRKDLCTDPACFGAKTEAHWKAEKAAAKEGGLQVLTVGESKQLFGYDNRVMTGQPWISLGAVCELAELAEGEKPPIWKKILGPEAKATAIARNPMTKRIFHLIDQPTARTLAEGQGYGWASKLRKTMPKTEAGGSSSAKKAPTESQQWERQRQKRMREERVMNRVFCELAYQVGKAYGAQAEASLEESQVRDNATLRNAWWRTLSSAILGPLAETIREICYPWDETWRAEAAKHNPLIRLGVIWREDLPKGKTKDALAKLVGEWCAKATVPEMVQAYYALIVLDWNVRGRDALKSLLAHEERLLKEAKVDLQTVVAEVKAAVASETKAAAPAAGGKEKPKPKAKKAKGESKAKTLPRAGVPEAGEIEVDVVQP